MDWPMFSSTTPPPAPQGYTAEELARFQEQLQPVLQTYRRRRRLAWAAFALALAMLAKYMVANGLSLLSANKALFAKGLPWYGQALLVSPMAAFVLLMATCPRLRCPGCGALLGSDVRRYCPECGSDQLERNCFGVPHCRSCDKLLKTNRSGAHRWIIHNCTTCGLLVDTQGIDR